MNEDPTAPEVNVGHNSSSKEKSFQPCQAEATPTHSMSSPQQPLSGLAPVAWPWLSHIYQARLHQDPLVTRGQFRAEATKGEVRWPFPGLAHSERSKCLAGACWGPSVAPSAGEQTGWVQHFSVLNPGGPGACISSLHVFLWWCVCVVSSSVMSDTLQSHGL